VAQKGMVLEMVTLEQLMEDRARKDEFEKSLHNLKSLTQPTNRGVDAILFESSEVFRLGNENIENTVRRFISMIDQRK
jgi:hypothetical protein